jgi:hypothetical protein
MNTPDHKQAVLVLKGTEILYRTPAYSFKGMLIAVLCRML